MTKMEELIHHFIVVTEGLDAPPGEVYFGAENPKGELGFYINSRGGGVPYRLKIRAPSFVNLSILPELLPGCLISDVPAVLGSLDFGMGEGGRRPVWRRYYRHTRHCRSRVRSTARPPGCAREYLRRRWRR